MVFFFLFLWNMLCGIWSEGKNDPAVRKKNQQRVRVVIKMFFVMGIAWIAEIVSFFLTWAVGNDAVYREVFFFQIINSLQVSEKGLLTNRLMKERAMSAMKVNPSRRPPTSPIMSNKL